MPDECACDEIKTAVPMADTLCEAPHDNVRVTPINITFPSFAVFRYVAFS